MPTSKTKLIVISVIAVVVIAIALYLFLSIKKSPVVSPPTPQAAAETETLGGKIYDQASNPIQDKVPTVNPVTNPVQGLYKNPFE